MNDITKMRPQKEIVANMQKLGFKWTYKSQQKYADGNKFNDFYKDEILVSIDLANGRFWINKNRCEIASYKTPLENDKLYDAVIKALNVEPTVLFGNGIGTVIKQTRKQLGLTRMDLAVASKIDVVYLDLIERNKRTVGLNLIVRISEALNLCLLELEIYKL